VILRLLLHFGVWAIEAMAHSEWGRLHDVADDSLLRFGFEEYGAWNKAMCR
jgi:hypothetical protein